MDHTVVLHEAQDIQLDPMFGLESLEDDFVQHNLDHEPAPTEFDPFVHLPDDYEDMHNIFFSQAAGGLATGADLQSSILLTPSSSGTALETPPASPETVSRHSAQWIVTAAPPRMNDGGKSWQHHISLK